MRLGGEELQVNDFCSDQIGKNLREELKSILVGGRKEKALTSISCKFIRSLVLLGTVSHLITADDLGLDYLNSL